MKPLTDYTEAELLGARDEELNGLLAQHIFGYRWLTFNEKANVKTEKVRWLDAREHYQSWQELASGDEKIADWFLLDLPKWSSTGNGMLEVLEAMKAEWEINIEWPRDDKYRVWFGDFVADHASLPRAVAVAALLAVRVAK